jgi:phage FluMu protein Com
MRIKCQRCSEEHVRADELIVRGVRAGAIAYVDSLCPWCRFVYDLGKTLNSPLGVVLCAVAISAVAVKIKESLS